MTKEEKNLLDNSSIEQMKQILAEAALNSTLAKSEGLAISIDDPVVRALAQAIVSKELYLDDAGTEYIIRLVRTRYATKEELETARTTLQNAINTLRSQHNTDIYNINEQIQAEKTKRETEDARLDKKIDDAQASLADAIGNIKGLEYKVVESLPAPGKDGVLYLVPTAAPTENNQYDEYIWAGDGYEFLGTTAFDPGEIDLSNYVKKTGDTMTGRLRFQGADNPEGAISNMYLAPLKSTVDNRTMGAAMGVELPEGTSYLGTNGVFWLILDNYKYDGMWQAGDALVFKSSKYVTTESGVELQSQNYTLRDILEYYTRTYAVNWVQYSIDGGATYTMAYYTISSKMEVATQDHVWTIEEASIKINYDRDTDMRWTGLNLGILYNPNTDAFLPLTGGTLTGNLRLQNGNFGSIINFGDGDYVHISEPSDDTMEIKGSYIRFVTGTGKPGAKFTVNGINILVVGDAFSSIEVDGNTLTPDSTGAMVFPAKNRVYTSTTTTHPSDPEVGDLHFMMWG